MSTFAYVSNSGDGTLTKIDLDGFDVVSVTTASSTFVANQRSNFLTVRKALTVGTGPSGLAIDPAGTFAYVAIAGAGSNSVRKIDLSTFLTVGPPVTVGQGPRMVAIDSSGTYAYTPNYISKSVTRIKLSSFTTALSLHLAANPVSIVIDATGTFAYVVNAAPSVTKIDLKTFTLSAALALSAIGGTQFDVAIDPSGSYLYVTNHNGGTLTKIALSTFSVVATLTIATPHSIVIDSSGSFAYVTNQSTGTVTKIDLTTFNLVGSPLAVGSGPSGIALDSNGNIYVTNALDGTVSLIDHETFTVIDTLKVGNNPQRIVIDSARP
jgi:YVTN family beta-propeller protein